MTVQPSWPADRRWRPPCRPRARRTCRALGSPAARCACGRSSIPSRRRARNVPAMTARLLAVRSPAHPSEPAVGDDLRDDGAADAERVGLQQRGPDGWGADEGRRRGRAPTLAERCSSRCLQPPRVMRALFLRRTLMSMRVPPLSLGLGPAPVRRPPSRPGHGAAAGAACSNFWRSGDEFDRNAVAACGEVPSSETLRRRVHRVASTPPSRRRSFHGRKLRSSQGISSQGISPVR